METKQYLLGVALIVMAILAGVFAVMWYGANVENRYLNKELNDARSKIDELTKQLQIKTEELQQKMSQLLDLQNKLQATTQQLNEAQQKLEQTQRQLAEKTTQLQEVQRRLAEVNAQLQNTIAKVNELQRQRDSLISQISNLNATLQTLRSKVHAGRDIVEALRKTLNTIALKAPQVGDSWTFTHTYKLTGLTLRNQYYHKIELELSAYQTVEIQTSDSLWIAFFTPTEYEKWAQGYSATPLAQGRGYVRFTPPRNGTYILVRYNDLGRDVSYDITYRYSSTWRYYDAFPVSPQRPYVVGDVGVPSREIFRMYAIYNYWLENRAALASEVQRQLASRGTLAFSPTYTDIKLSTDILYALSLAALLKDAGFDVSFTAIGTDWEDPLKPSSAIVQVRFTSIRPANNTLYNFHEILPTGWMHIAWYQRESRFNYELIVLIDTYNVIRIIDLGRDTTIPYNVIFVDGITKLE